ncbi:MAG: asparagine synthetase A [Thermoprotei archaeon]
MEKGCCLTPRPRFSPQAYSCIEPGYEEILAKKPPVVRIKRFWIVGKEPDYVIARNYKGLFRISVHGKCSEELARLPLETLVEALVRDTGDQIELLGYKVLVKPLAERSIDYLKADEWEPREYALNAIWGIKHPRYRYTVILQSVLLRELREALYRRGFIELLPPMISPTSDPGLRGAKRLKTKYYGVEYELTSSVIMYKQLSVAVFEKVFFTARNIREEPVKNAETGRHLAEFTQIDIEWGLASTSKVMSLAEEILREVSEIISNEYNWLIESIGLRREPVVFETPFPKVTYDEALSIARKLGYDVEWGKELSFEAEKAIAMYYNVPVWITNFPVTSRGFYYLPLEDDSRYNDDFNLILPEGYGEVVDGGAREYRYEKLVKRIKAMGEDVKRYEWFLELVKQGAIPPSSGWGLGLERLTAYIAGHKHVVYATPFPKLPGITGTP